MKRIGGLALLVAPFVPFLLGYRAGEGLLAGVLLALAGLAAPGLACAAALGARDAGRSVTYGLAGATALLLLAMLVRKATGLPATPRVFAALLGVPTLLLGAIALRRSGPALRPGFLPVLAATGAMLLAAYAGTRLVPALEDQDSEVQGTAYGWIHDLQPFCLTNRSTLYFFAHPPLLHLHNAVSLALAGDLETVRPPRDLAMAAREAQPAPRGGRIARAMATLRGETATIDRSRQWYREVYAPFRKTPALAGTRAPNFALAAAVALLLASAARRFGAGAGDTALVLACYVTLPEIVVRSGYGGYYALTAATLLAGARLAAEDAGGGRAAFSGGVLAMLANQKAIVLGAAVAIVRGAESLGRRSRAALGPALPWLLGLAAGGAIFWIYGLAVSPEEFVKDHLLEHGLLRFSGGEVLSRAGNAVYESRLGIWIEFVRHFGGLWCALVAAAILRAASSLRGDPESGGREVRILLVWIGLGALLFTATDWRQTKHLCLLVPAMVPLLARLLAGLGPRLRWTMRGALAVSLVWNLIWLVRLAHDFEAMSVTPVW